MLSCNFILSYDIGKEVVMNKKIIFPGIIILLIALGIKHTVLSGFNMEFYEGLITNIVTEIVSIILTVVIIGNLIKKEEEKEKLSKEKLEKEEYDQLIKNVLGNQLSKLYQELSSTYINFVAKEPLQFGPTGPNFEETDNAIKQLIENIDSYVDKDFRKKEIRAFITEEKEPLRKIPTEQTISYQRFCLGIFRAKFEYHIDNFIQRYISVLPEDIRLTLYKMENSIKDFIFVTPLEFTGEEVQMPTNKQDQEKIKNHLLIIGNGLNDIYKLIRRP